jgi:hypothetical protein
MHKLFLVVAASLAMSPTPQELRNRYGDPDVERFRARPGVGLTVEYGSDGVACQMLIEPPGQGRDHAADRCSLSRYTKLSHRGATRMKTRYMTAVAISMMYAASVQ